VDGRGFEGQAAGPGPPRGNRAVEAGPQSSLENAALFGPVADTEEPGGT